MGMTGTPGAATRTGTARRSPHLLRDAQQRHDPAVRAVAQQLHLPPHRGWIRAPRQLKHLWGGWREGGG